MPIRLICSTDGPLCLRSATTSFWHNRCRRGPSTPTPKAKASTSSASGLFQFVEATWFKALRSFGWRYGHEQEAKAIQGDDNEMRVAPQKRAELLRLRNDPYLSAVLAAEMLKHDGEGIASRLGRPLTQGETYLIHF